jgi:kynureninase
MNHVSTERGHAKALDAADTLASYRSRFAFPARPDGSPVVYLLGNSLGLMPDSARAAVEDEMQRWGTLAIDGWFRGSPSWYEYQDAFREAAGRVVGARPHEVIMMNTLTMNLHVMMISFYRPVGTRTKILMEANAFPSDRYAVASQVRMHGLDPAATVLVARPREGETSLRTEDLEGLLAERGEEIALVMMGGVNYLSGQWLDLERITAAGQAQGCVVGFDLAHAAGNVPLALHDWDVDFAVWCTYKYLNGGPGSIGGCFIHDRHAADHDLPRLTGWWGNDPAVRFEMRESFEPHVGADGWQVSNPSMLSMAPVKASLELFDDVGMEALRAKSVDLTGYVEALLRGSESDRFDIITPADPGARGCQLSLRIHQGAQQLFAALAERGVVVDFREPDVIRVAPAPFYNSFEDVWTLVDELKRALELDG